MANSYKLGNPIWVYYHDIDTNENLQVPKLLRGVVGESYQVDKKKFPNYRFIKADTDLSGTFDMRQHQIHLYYRKDNWAEVQKNISMYLHLDAPTPMYDLPGGMQVGAALPRDIIVKAFARVATKTGEFWYELGADQWVLYDHMRVVKNPFDERPTAPTGGRGEQVSTISATPAVVDFVPGRSIDVYDNPFGRVVGSVKNGDKLTITGKQSDSTGVTWYKAARIGYISSLYVKLIKQDNKGHNNQTD